MQARVQADQLALDGSQDDWSVLLGTGRQALINNVCKNHKTTISSSWLQSSHNDSSVSILLTVRFLEPVRERLRATIQLGESLHASVSHSFLRSSHIPSRPQVTLNVWREGNSKTTIKGSCNNTFPEFAPGFLPDFGDLKERHRRRSKAYVEDCASKDRPRYHVEGDA